jgi:hypothetical protein
MGNAPINTASETICGVLTDLREVFDRLTGSLATGLPMDELQTERQARILDRLAEEVGEAAQMVRASR